MTDIWEVWKDICHSNHVMKIKVKVLGPEPGKKICVCAWGCWCANVNHIEKVWIGRCDVKRGHKLQVLICKQSKALDGTSWELPFKETALVFLSSSQGKTETEVWGTKKVSGKLLNRRLLPLMFVIQNIKVFVSWVALFSFWGGRSNTRGWSFGLCWRVFWFVKLLFLVSAVLSRWRLL